MASLASSHVEDFQEYNRREVLNKLVKWVIFSVIVSLLPLFINLLLLYLNGIYLTIAYFSPHGELLLISVTICAIAIGDVIGTGKKYLALKLLAAGGCVLILIFSSSIFAILSLGSIIPENSATASAITDFSLITFLFSLLTSSGCVYLSEVR
ncbi:MAG: hypothetical protein ACOYYU_16855 [Chloroflexota bacterium]